MLSACVHGVEGPEALQVDVVDGLVVERAEAGDYVVAIGPFLPVLAKRLAARIERQGLCVGDLLQNVQLEPLRSLAQLLWTLEALATAERAPKLLVVDMACLQQATHDAYELGLIRSISLQLKRLSRLCGCSVLLVCLGPAHHVLWQGSVHCTLTLRTSGAESTAARLVTGTRSSFVRLQ
ncbi:hypothetical protein SPRG_02223 [Saprolegnia parasitica CBS 223.65]|uniref:DNA recombination and repair protein Rad51-like C-terminal domain-containing protein n=1 Tax=Saprolegnia parasitica (strain CBS 223.65) TaxID=695850 RepID=A0A067D3U3_SAPPC|nr:hypothetical protein SPRG_02223 [Saprolegnia parasitica CBS 223.65]KDO33416.1 hypothetical protein SPRG_02223 [Saprolegnia parasitica CBS 223.65]|eukprot:XP_012196162.1 hypothetical protein SPRG_02223 [Saprolegnia parasitica CBS 223.65]